MSANEGHAITIELSWGKVMIMSSEDLTRRGFVGAVGVTAGAASFFGAPAIGKAALANEKIRLGIIGAGSRGDNKIMAVGTQQRSSASSRVPCQPATS